MYNILTKVRTLRSTFLLGSVVILDPCSLFSAHIKIITKKILSNMTSTIFFYREADLLLRFSQMLKAPIHIDESTWRSIANSVERYFSL